VSQAATSKPVGRLLRRYIPIVGWLPNYQRRWLGRDAIAGVAVASVAIPTSMGYAGIAHVPVQVGLYALPLALLLYAIFGSSRQLAVGPSSTVAIMSGASLVSLGVVGDVPTAIALTAAMAITAGLMLVAAGVLGFGWATDFISRPVITGFTFGLGIVVVVAELPHILGIPTAATTPYGRVIDIAENLEGVSFLTIAVGVFALAVMFLGSWWRPHWPWALALMIVAIVVAGFLNPGQYGMETLGSIPAGLPDFGIPTFEASQLPGVLLGGAAIALVGTGEGLSAGRIYAAKGNYRIRSSQEFIGAGAANIGSGLSSGMAVCGSVSRTGTAVASGAKTQVSALVALVTIVVVLLTLTDTLDDLPRVILSAVVIASVWSLMDVSTMKRYWRIRRNDFVAAATGLLGVIALGPLYGLLAAVAISLLGLVYRSNRIIVDPVGMIPDERAGWGFLPGHPERQSVPGILVLRLGAPIFWANAARTGEAVLQLVDEERQELTAVVLDLEATGQLDITSVDMLTSLIDALKKDGVDTYFARVLPQTMEVIRKAGLADELGEDHFWHSITYTVEQACEQHGLAFDPPSGQN